MSRQGDQVEMMSRTMDLQRTISEGVLEIRGDGRAGSGIILAMQSLAALAIADPTLHAQEWPFFSSARKGAPTRGFLRLSRRPIEKSSEITHPHLAIVMDLGVAAIIDFAEGVPPGGIFVFNTNLAPEAIARRYHLSGTIYTIDGDKLSEPFLKKPMGNISVIALLTELLPCFEPAHAIPELAAILTKRRLPTPLVKANCELFTASLGKSAMAECNFAQPTDHRIAPFTGYGELMPGAQSRLRLSRSNLTSIYARTGYRLRFADPDGTCNGCGHCIINCPENIIEFRPDPSVGVRVTGAMIAQYCKLCRECIAICPKQLFTEEAVES